MFPAVMSNSTSVSQEGSSSSVTRDLDFASLQPQQIKNKRTHHENSDPEVIALPHEALLANNRFICEVCNKGFYRDQILQLHRRQHNLPWNLKQRDDKRFEKKVVYVCPVPTCVHHEPSRALSDFTVLKKHYTRKHGEKMWKCETCPKIYALKSDWKSHSKTCGAKEYKCDCGIIFSRENDLINHKALCNALPGESDRLTVTTTNPNGNSNTTALPTFDFNNQILLPLWIPSPQNPSPMALPFEDLPEY